ncbi:hypothetical protein [Flavobacterium ginsenosidimutans]|uniref:hypothetical protein n=1 Tax=Flavobacterium ginsenosidimutans TaxID=687844 RepID=UPI0013A6668F|nr:hypothetical protein [Flavobacterium ginsenosidimutans]KAF2332357.1 hypothetical protein DM444_10375 [Flavobacterium ginsenosidimutans]
MELSLEDFSAFEMTTEEQQTINGGDQGKRLVLQNNYDCSGDEYCVGWYKMVY